MATIQDEGDAIKLVYKASVAGCVSTLNELIETSPLILRKFSLTTFTETPLHVSALLGHHDFTRTLLTHNPNLAKELDSFRRSPLHLASAEGHEEIVQVLLHADHVDVCLFHDQDGRIPLHYSAMRGRLGVLKKLIRAKPESIFVSVLNRSRETALHLCVKYNQLECLKLLVEHVGEQRSEFLHSKDTVGGQTILHLALVLKQTETIRYLLSIPIIREEANDVIRSYVLEHNSGDIRNLELQQIVIGHNDDHHHQQPLSSVPPGMTSANVLDNNAAEKVSKARWRTKLMKYLNYPTDWLEDTRGVLIVVAGMIATMTFQAAVNPPGGVWQVNNTDSTINSSGSPSSTESQTCYAGSAVLACATDSGLDHIFLLFMNFNTISFLASLSVTFLLISGFPLHNRLCMWLLSMGMCIVLSCLALSYLVVVIMIIPNQAFELYSSTTYNIIIYVWISLVGMVVLIHTLRFFIWLGKRLRRRFRHN
ncbi:ankyrin repeat-containing protein BDA1-like [Rosa rugosa]|uniref:ankyrin repeat-containing protein BDA1-like n=1 Tax=Rosa rugosa TaxID=74645 RepID=UPI002B4118AE|nr:ankyrin repeat-containing protein BDA1-like [Rosa rugosa]